MGHVRHADWRDQVERFRESGLTQQQWCESSGTNLHNLRYWLRKERDSCLEVSDHVQGSSWMPLQIIEGPAFPSSAIEHGGKVVIRIGEASIAVEPGFSAQHLLQVLQTVRAL